MMENLRQIIDKQLANENDGANLKKLIVDLAELADKKGATEAEMKEIFHMSLDDKWEFKQ